MVHWFLLTFRTICMSNLYELKSLDNKSKLHNKKLALSLLLILVSNDVQVNPGPPRLAQKATFPCRYCETHVEHPKKFLEQYTGFCLWKVVNQLRQGLSAMDTLRSFKRCGATKGVYRQMSCQGITRQSAVLYRLLTQTIEAPKKRNRTVRGGTL